VEARMTMVIYGDFRSGNCLKVKWTADRLGLVYDWVDVDIMRERHAPRSFGR
jgi:glutathione S-transferase